MESESIVFNRAVEALASLPGIGKKTAIRLVLELLKKEKNQLFFFSEAIKALTQNIQYCQKCFNLCQHDFCQICTHLLRDEKTICVVEDIRDLLAIENTGQYQGHYHVLGGLLSPIKGIHPDQLTIQALLDRVLEQEVKEVILALKTDTDGEMTSFYIYKHLFKSTKITTLARGVGINEELQYTDENTLAQSLIHRIDMERTISY